MSWIHQAKIGNRVVCVNDDWADFALRFDEIGTCDIGHRVPMINEVLTITGFRAGTKRGTKHIVWLFFEEIGHGWTAKHFRPLNDRPTDIAVFERLLNTAPAKETEDA